jgi:archaetidylinositol phosphate synthase
LAFAADSLDGAVARLRKETSHFGGYLDAMIDRYQELAVLMTLAFHYGQWPAAMASFSGAIITSYAKARVAIETPIKNNNWPDFFERQERVMFVCALLVAQSLGNHGVPLLGEIMGPGLWLFAALCHFTAIQRFLRAKSILTKLDRDLKS